MAFLNLFNVVHAVCRVNKFHLKLFISVILISAIPAHTHAEYPEREFASHALALRQSALDGEPQFIDVMNRIPGAGIMDSEVLSYLWSLSFTNMIVKLGRHRSETPVSLYYTPLLDVAVLVFWERDEAGYHVKIAQALPGEWLGSKPQESSVLPPWIVEENALSSLLQTTGERFDKFDELHPPGTSKQGEGGATFAEAAGGMREVLPRLVWNADQHLKWTDENLAYPWLEKLLIQMETALSAADSQQLLSMAPGTDAVTAEALAQLPGEYIEEITLDLVAGSSENQLLIASSPADGDTYIMAMCKIDGLQCRPSRLVLLSLTD